MSNINIESLIELASKKMGVSADSLRSALKNGDVKGITANLSESDRAKVDAVLNDPKLSEKFRNKYTGGK